MRSAASSRERNAKSRWSASRLILSSMLLFWIAACITDMDSVQVTGLFLDPAGQVPADSSAVSGVVYVGYALQFRGFPSCCPDPNAEVGAYSIITPDTGDPFTAGTVFDADQLAEGHYRLKIHVFPLDVSTFAERDSDNEIQFTVKHKKAKRCICPDPTNLATDASSSGLPNTKKCQTGNEGGSGNPPDPNQQQPAPGGPGCICEKCQQKNCDLLGDPVDLVTGELMEMHSEIGWFSFRGMHMLMRHYRSGMSQASGQFGLGWMHMYERKIQDNGASAKEIDGRGEELDFASNGAGAFTPRLGAMLTHEADDTWTVRYPTGMVYRYRTDKRLDSIIDPYGNTTRCEYSATGDLVRIVDPAGKAITLEVTDGLIRKATGKGGIQAQYAYTPDRRLTVVMDARGNATRYTYDPTSGLLSSIQGPTGDRAEYTYEGGKVTQVRDVSADGRESITRFEYPSALVRRYIDSAGRVTTYEYNDAGLLVKRTGADGLVQTREFDTAGRLVKLTQPDGAVHQWAYADTGAIQSYTSPKGEVTRVERDPITDRPLALTHPDGTRTERAFDDAGGLTSVKDAQGNVTRYARNAQGQVATTTDPQGRVSTATYDADGYLASFTDAAGRVTAYQVDASGRDVAVTDPAGRTTRTEYEGESLVKAAIDAANQRTVYENDAGGRVTAITGPDGARTEYTYTRLSGQDLVVQTKDPDGGISKTVYDSSGHVTAQIDANGRTTRYTLDAIGRVTRIDFPDGTFTLTRYNSAGLVSETENALGAVTRYFYDPNGRLIRTEYPDGSSAGLGYDSQGRITTRTNAEGGVTTTVYDSLGRPTATISPLGFVRRTEYTTTGAVKRTINARDKATQYQQDALDRLVKTIDAMGFTTRQEYGPGGEVTLVVNARGAETRYRFDALSRLVEVTDPLANSVKREFDSAGRLTKVIDENGHFWSFTYSTAGLRLTETDPNGRVTRHTYNAGGELVTTVFPDGSRWRYTRDSGGRIVSRRLEKADGTLEDEDRYAFDIAGRPVSAENNAVKITSVYDSMDRETSRTTYYKATGVTRQVQTIFDIMGRRQLESLSSGRMVRYLYDKDSRPVQILVIEPDPLAACFGPAFRTRSYSFAWDANSNLTQVTYPNGVRVRREFDDLDRLTRLVHERVTPDKTTALASFDYVRDAVGNVVQITNERGEVTAFEHDKKDQLVRALLPKDLVNRLRQADDAKVKGKDSDDAAEERLCRTEQVSYTYDPTGNRIQEDQGGRVLASTFSPANELLTRGSVTYRYDERGNQIEKAYSSGRRQVFNYSVANRLASFGWAKKADDDDRDRGRAAQVREVERYAYSPAGERVSVLDAESQRLTQFLWNASRAIEEFYSADGGKKEKSVHYLRDATGQLLELARLERRGANTFPDGGCDDDRDDDSSDAARQMGHVRFVGQDHLGSTVLLTNAVGNRVDRLSYAPFGEPLEGNHDRVRFTYTGHQRERATGDYYSVQRYLDPRIGRWTQRDPAGGPDGTNVYSYVRSSPTRLTDIAGLFSMTVETGKPPDIVIKQLYDQYVFAGNCKLDLGVGLDASVAENVPGRGGLFFGGLFAAQYFPGKSAPNLGWVRLNKLTSTVNGKTGVKDWFVDSPSPYFVNPDTDTPGPKPDQLANIPAGSTAKWEFQIFLVDPTTKQSYARFDYQMEMTILEQGKRVRVSLTSSGGVNGDGLVVQKGVSSPEFDRLVKPLK